MGSTAGKFKKHLLSGDEFEALQVFHCSPELHRDLDPNFSYGDAFQHNTPLHLAALHGMTVLLRTFLMDLCGCPNKRNASGETALHMACRCNLMKSSGTQECRICCVDLLLQWRGSNGLQKMDIAAVDNEGNTALHNAAAAGLYKCVNLLVSAGAPIFAKNNSGETACDLAEKNNHKEIAELLEAKMVFSMSCEECSSLTDKDSKEEIYTGLSPQDLQEAKDELLVETSDMLHVPLHTAEVLLRNHEWSRERLLENWMINPIKCCEEACVSLPASALHFSISNNSLKMSCERIQEEYQNETLNSPAKTVPFTADFLCEICVSYIPLHETSVSVPCSHLFCLSCWKAYLTVRIKEGDAPNILCPAFDCHYLVPIDIVEKVVSPSLVRRYLRLDIEAFVETNPHIKWCPHPGCGRAVKLAEKEPLSQEVMSIVAPLSVSHSVDCGNGHFFCWECLGEAHAPCGCDKWQEWHDKIAEIKPQEMKNTVTDSDDAANWLWKVTNSKPCPNCKSPIQKDEGCNHMKCSKCRYDYCWECLEGWKKHSSATGGYFRCNRLDAVRKAEVRNNVLVTEAEAHNKQMQGLNKFLQYYKRFRNHENNYKFEQPLLHNVQEKMVLLSSTSGASSLVNVQFLEDALCELLRSRQILCGSYVYGYYLEDNGYNKTIFEFLQNELELSAEKLSEMVSRSYLQTPYTKIISATNTLEKRRIEFVCAVLEGLIPPETPPIIRKERQSYSGLDSSEDEQLSQAILASLHDFDPNNPWVKDEQGRHKNLEAINDWPYTDSDDEIDYEAVASGTTPCCGREGCSKPCVRNCRTGAMHSYCSIICKYAEQNKEESSLKPEVFIDPNVELMIAIELSKRQVESADFPDVFMSNEHESSPKEILSENSVSDQEELLSSSGENYTEKNAATDSKVDDSQIWQEIAEGIQELMKEQIMAEGDKEIAKENDENCDTTAPLLSSPEDKSNSFAETIKNTSVDFYLKDSLENSDINSKNIDSSADIFSKTDKELFSDVEKTSSISRQNITRSSHHSL